MNELYQNQRTGMIVMQPGMAWLPEEPPQTAPQVTALSNREWRPILAPVAATHASSVVIAGWGDGSALWRLIADPQAKTKTFYLAIFAGEEAAFAASLTQPFFQRLLGVPFAFTLIRSGADVVNAMVEWFPRHKDVPQLAGVDIVRDHPLCPEATATRGRLIEDLITALMDRPQTYGNDIIDSWQGLSQSAANAKLLLPAPSIGEMAQYFGDRPVISIAAGPSVRHHLDELRVLQHEYPLVCCDAVLHGLIDQGIYPHFVTPLERVDMVRPMMTRAAESPNTIYAGLPVVMPDVVERFRGRAMGVYCGDALYDWLYPDCPFRVNSGLSTGVLAVNVAAALTRGPVYLVGHDLAQTPTDTHWDGAAFAKSEWAKGSGLNDAPALSGYEARMVAGNDGGVVASTAWWDRFREGIAHTAGWMRNDGRVMYNVNAHDRVFAHIDHCGAAPLPAPGMVTPLPSIVLPPEQPQRLRQWVDRARLLPADCDAFTKQLAAVRDDIATMRRGSAGGWDPAKIAARITYDDSGISAGNRLAFAYFLRSAMHNVNADMHWHRRVANAAQARWRMLDSIDQVGQAMINALGKLRIDMEGIVRDLDA